MNILRNLFISFALSVMLACGGGGGSDSPQNQSPTANAGSDQAVSEGSTVTLTGSGSDSDGTIASYSWSIVSGGEGVNLSSTTVAMISFIAPTTNSSLQIVLRLTVTDDAGATGSDEVTITVNTTNISPTADAGSEQSVNEGETVNLNASASADSDGSIASFSWTQVSGVSVSLTNANSATPSFIAPGVSIIQLLIFEVTVTDDRNATATAQVTVIVNPIEGVNISPTANAGIDQTVNGTSTVTLNGTGSSDIDGEIVIYSWSQTSGTSVSLSATDTASVTFTAPDVMNNETLTFQLEVTDNEDASASDSVDIIVEPKPIGTTISGKITYDNVPHNTTTNGLNYGATTQDPVRGATIYLMQNSTLLDSTVTDENGDYSFVAANNISVTILVRAELKQASTQAWDVKVVNNTSSNALYTLSSSTIATGSEAAITQNLHAASGWGGSSYTSTRAAAPFHILDRIYEVINKLKPVDSNLNLNALIINWSPNNDSALIGTSHYTNDQIFLLGIVNVDTDEYDGHVIIHEWAHFFEDNHSRSDSVGGSHGGGDRLDMRVAFGEGFGNAWSGIITDDSFYRDSFGTTQSQGFSINVESNSGSNPGWFSESSVQSIIYDIYDNNNDGNDTLSLGLQPIYDVLIDQEKNTEAFTSIFSFMSYMKETNVANVAGLNSLLTGQNIQSNIDIWGSSETDNEGQASVIPVYVTLTAGENANVCTITAFGSDSSNKLGHRKFVRLNISSNGSYTLRLTPTGAHDLDGYLYNKGASVAFNQDGGTAVANITANLNVGTYVADTLAYNSAGNAIAAACYNIALIAN